MICPATRTAPFLTIKFSLSHSIYDLFFLAENHHKCQQKCHDGACGECNGVTELTCVCGAVKKDFPCPELAKFSGEYACGVNAVSAFVL